MSTELSTPLTLVNPATGEALTLDSPTEDLGRFLADMREHESLWREAKNVVQGEIRNRMDQQKKWTLHVPGLKLTAPSPAAGTPEEWDGAALRSELLELADEGTLSIEAVDAAVEVIVTYKVHKAGINALRAGQGAPAEIVDRLAMRGEKPRYVTVSRA